MSVFRTGLRWTRYLLVGVGSLATGGALFAIADYQATQCASGCTAFGSAIISTVHYAKQLLVDTTGAPLDNGAGQLKVTAGAATIGGSVINASVTGTSSQVALPASITTYPTLVLKNNGTSDLFINTGTSSAVTATTTPSATNIKIPACSVVEIATPAGTTNVAAILASGSTATELDIVQSSAPIMLTTDCGAVLSQILASVQGAIPTQVPTTSIGGVGIVDSAGTNVATVKAASTPPVSGDKTLVVGMNPNAPMVSFGALSPSSVTRVANTTTYTPNTGWCTLASSCVTTFSFTSACRANGAQVLIPEIDIWSSANPTTKLQGILWLFSTVPGTIIGDDATFTIASADFANLTGPHGGLPFTLANNQAAAGANSSASLTGVTYMAQCASGATTIFGMVQVVNAYVPASAEVLNISLRTVGVN